MASGSRPYPQTPIDDSDRAMYSCQCGLVFEAEVSTTVICPHCGRGLAW